MANFILQELPEEMADGKKIVFPKMQNYSQHDFETVISHMQTYDGSLSEGIIRCVFSALTQTMTSWMPLGHTIKIKGLGTFSLRLGYDTTTPSEQAEARRTDDDQSPKTRYRRICIKSINFKPDPQLIAGMNREADFDRVMKDVKVPQRCQLTLEERIAKAREMIASTGYMTLADYVRGTGLSRTAASKDLKRICADASSGITTRGSGSHKVWISKRQQP